MDAPSEPLDLGAHHLTRPARPAWSVANHVESSSCALARRASTRIAVWCRCRCRCRTVQHSTRPAVGLDGVRGSVGGRVLFGAPVFSSLPPLPIFTSKRPNRLAGTLGLLLSAPNTMTRRPRCIHPSASASVRLRLDSTLGRTFSCLCVTKPSMCGHVCPWSVMCLVLLLPHVRAHAHGAVLDASAYNRGFLVAASGPEITRCIHPNGLAIHDQHPGAPQPA